MERGIVADLLQGGVAEDDIIFAYLSEIGEAVGR
jgi:hypothetical protein